MLYLGKPVNCSNPSTNKDWWQLLDCNSSEPVREIAQDAKNLHVNPVSTSNTELTEKNDERRMQIEGTINVGHLNIKGGGGFYLERKVTTSSKTTLKYKPTEMITFLTHTSEDPNSALGFEVELCKHILDEIETTLKDSIEEIKNEIEKKDDLEAEKKEFVSMKENLESSVKGMALNSPVTVFENFVRDHSDPKKESLIWKMVADACTSYINGKQFCTHYVNSITIGTVFQESERSSAKSSKVTGMGDVKGLDAVDASNKVEHETVQEERTTITLERGSERKPEVIGVGVRELSDLIGDKSRELSKLKGVLTKLIRRHRTVDKGTINYSYTMHTPKNSFIPRHFVVSFILI